MGFLAPWFLAGARRHRAAGLRPSAAAVPAEADAVQLAHVLRAADAELHQAPPPEVSAAVRPALRCSSRCWCWRSRALTSIRRPSPTPTAAAPWSSPSITRSACARTTVSRKPNRPRSTKSARWAPGDRGQVITFGGPAKLLTDMTPDKQAAARRGAGARTGRRRQFLRGNFARPALHCGKPEDRYRRPRLYRCAEILLPAELLRSAPGRRHEARDPLGCRQADAQLDGGKRGCSPPRLRHEEGPHRRHHRRLQTHPKRPAK